ncbi:hypothetical protein P8864_19520 [Priestia flexa]|uniref:hypothetical protein n=1 Tax=Priestia flexa TaxID=86664 RepID=UPI000C23D02B|nr:hypothetical protein [Priestia flexa]MEC0668047.1 hypothetical protein [Priestia flexa]MED3823053.1 hypothetical protein [Priestia flexa]
MSKISVTPRELNTIRRAASKTGGVVTLRKKSIEEMEKELGLDKVKPMELATSDDQIAIEEGDCFAKWYEEELRELYERE